MNFIRKLFKKGLEAERKPDTFSMLLSQIITAALPNVDKNDKGALIKVSSGFAYALTNKIANDVAKVPFRLMTKKRGTGLKTCEPSKTTKQYMYSERSGIKLKSVDEVQEVYEHPIIDLLDDMNDYNDGIDENTNTELQQLKIGNAFWMADRGDDQSLDPQRLHLLSGDRVEIITDDKIFRKIIGYKYGDKTLKPSEIIHFKYSSSEDWLWGTSPLAAAIEFHNTSGNLASLLKELSLNKNGMDLYITNKQGNEQTLGGKQLEDLKKQFANFRIGKIKADEIMYLADKELLAIPNMNKDLPFIENLKGLFKFMCWIFGVPDSIFAQESSNRAVQQSTTRDYYASCIQPKIIRKQSRLTRYLIPMFAGAKEKGLFLVGDDCVPLDIELLIKQVQGGVMTPNEAREMIKRDSMEGGELLYLPSTMIPIGMSIDEQGKQFAKAVKEEMEK